MRVGIVGTGSIGGMLARLFAGIPKLTVRIYNRSPEKMLAIARDFEDVELASSIQEVMRTCHIIFLCTKPLDGKSILEEFGASLTPSQVLATTISSIPLNQLETLTSAQVVKVIPSIAQSVKSGVCLVSYGSSFSRMDQGMFEGLIRDIATPFVVDESQIRVASDLTSCGPAFLSYLLLNWSNAAAETDHVTRTEAEHLLCQTVIGLAALLNRGMTLHDILQRVCVPGGVTQAGIEAIAPEVHRVFNLLHSATSAHVHPSPSHFESSAPITK